MNIAIIGATGQVGSRIAAEALARGHNVTGLARTPDPAKTPPGVKLIQADARQTASLAPLLQGHDAVITAAFCRDLQAESVAAALRQAGVRRLFVVGGAGSLQTGPGTILLDSPDFPDEYKPEALGAKAFLEDLRAIGDLDWTFLSPAALLEPGQRTGKFRIGGDRLLVGPDGQSRISIEDYAIAVLDELESPQHIRRRFTVAY